MNDITALDSVAVVAYSSLPQLVLDFTPDRVRARQMLQEINYSILSLRSNTASGWVNLSSSLAATIDWLASVNGTKIIVLLSSGIDTSPAESLPVVQEKLRRFDVRVLALSIFGDFRKPAERKRLSQHERVDRVFVKQGLRQFDDVLRELSQVSGGRAYFSKNRKDFDRAFAEIAQLVRGEYTLEFVPPAHDNQIHSVKVKIRRFGYHAEYNTGQLTLPLVPISEVTGEARTVKNCFKSLCIRRFYRKTI